MYLASWEIHDTDKQIKELHVVSSKNPCKQETVVDYPLLLYSTHNINHSTSPKPIGFSLDKLLCELIRQAWQQQFATSTEGTTQTIWQIEILNY